MTEKDFQRDLARGLRSQGCFVYPIPDLARAVTKPFDLCMSYESEFRPIECKLTKYTRKKPLGPDDVAISPKNFKGRGHQLPDLLKIDERNQGYPFVAACVVRVENGRVVEKRAWMVSIKRLESTDTWAIKELSSLCIELTWTPGIGWINPRLKAPVLSFVE